MEATEVIMSARTVEEARELGLKELGVDLEEAEIEILSHGKPPRFLGLGEEPARVRVRLIAAGSSIAHSALEIVTHGLYGQWSNPVGYRDSLRGLIKSPVQFFWNIEKTDR